MSLSVLDQQEQILLTISAKNYSDSSNRESLFLINKEKGIKQILRNTTVDKINNKVSVEYLYDKKKLYTQGEYYYGATKRVAVLHNKIVSKPEATTETDLYINEQVENKNYMKINPEEARLNNHQLHFVGYNLVVSSTSSFTKVRMTTDSSMHTESGLGLNKVTKPAPGDVPSLRGILMHSRCHMLYAVNDIKKFF